MINDKRWFKLNNSDYTIEINSSLSNHESIIFYENGNYLWYYSMTQKTIYALVIFLIEKNILNVL